MNKEYYNNCIKQFIKELMEEKENYASEIGEIATYIDFQSENNNLGRLDISAINEKRNNMGAIYELIENLNKLIKE